MPTLLLDAVPDAFEIEHDGLDVRCSVLVGQMDDGRYLTLDSSLSAMPDLPAGTVEFSFGFTVAGLEDDQEAYFTQDRDEVRRYLAGLPIDLILPTVCGALRALIAAVRPDFVYRVTKGRRMPEKALRKHWLISERLNELGYRAINSGTDIFGRTFWLFAR